MARLMAYVTGLVNQELLLQVEYLAAENRILRAHTSGRLRLSHSERSTLAEIGKRLGRKGLAKVAQVAQVAKPETILGWWRKLIAQKFDGSKHRTYPGRPRIGAEVEKLIVQMAHENSGWGYNRIVGALEPISVTTCRTRRSAMCFADMESRRPRNGARQRRGRTSSLHIWRCWRAWTSLPPRFSRGEVRRRTMFCL